MALIIREAPRDQWMKQEDAPVIKGPAADIYLDLKKLTLHADNQLEEEVMFG